MIKYTLDRCEGEYAVLIDEAANRLEALCAEIPENARVGDILIFDGEGYTIDYEQTRMKKESIRSRFDRLKKKRNGE